MNTPAYKRILLKLSGQILAGDRGCGIDPDVLSKISNKIIKLGFDKDKVSMQIAGQNMVYDSEDPDNQSPLIKKSL